MAAGNGVTAQEANRTRAQDIARQFEAAAKKLELLELGLAELVADRNERGASAEEMRVSVEGVVTSIEETSVTVHGLANAQREVSESAKETLRGLQGNASGLQELAASIAGIDKDTQVLAASAESTAAALEQVARTVKGVASLATNLSAASEQLAGAARETSVSLADGAARGEATATAIQEVAATVEELARGITRLTSDTQAAANDISATATALTGIAAGLERTAGHAGEMNAAADSVAAGAEEMLRSVRGVADQVRGFENSLAANASSVTEIAASVEEVAVTAEKSAQVVESNAGAVEQLARSSQSVAHGAELISSLATNTATASAQLDTTSKKITGVIEGARQHADRVLGAAREGGATVNRSIEGMKAIRSTMVESSGVIKEMGKKAEDIGDIVQAINLIADRTNLLSLNASIEAARAGEHGRGFAVVAEEIRALADRAATSSGDIAKIVRGLQSTARDAMTVSVEGVRAADEGSRLAADAERGLGLILSGVEELGAAVREIDRAGGEQASAISSLAQSASRTSDEARKIALGASEQTRVTQVVAQGMSEMRKSARQTKEATSEQAKALRDIVKANGEITAASKKISVATSEQTDAAAEMAKVASRMRQMAQQVSGATAEQTQATATISGMAQQVASAAQRTLLGLSEQAKGANELAHTVSEQRMNAAQTAKAVLEQARALKEIEGSVVEVRQSAAQLAVAMTEQTQTSLELTKAGDDVRRIAKQNSRALSEQAQVVSDLNTSTARYAATMERIVGSIGQQAAGSQQLGQVVTDIRGSARELSAAISAQAKAGQESTLGELLAQAQALRSSYLAEAEALAVLVRELGGVGAASTPTATGSSAAAPVANQKPAESGVTYTPNASASEPERLLRVRALVASGPSALDELLTLRLDPSWTVRREVVAALGLLGDTALPALCTSLARERDSETRIAATVDALVASNGDVEAALTELVAAADAAVLADVAQILGRRHSRTSLHTLALLVEHPDDNVAVLAIEALGRVGGRGVVDVLVKAVESRRFFRCFAAIGVLGKSGDPRAIAPLVALLDNPQCGFEAMRALGRTGDRAAVAALCRLLGASSDGTVRGAALALTDLRQRHGERLGTTLPIEQGLRDATPNGAARRLMNCMNGADVSEQVAIVVILGCLREDATTPTLLQALDGAPAVAAAAAGVLKQRANSSETQWAEALRSGNSLRREAILPIVSRANAVEAVLECLSDQSATVRRMACDALASIGKPEVTPALFQLLFDASPAVVQAAIAAITALGSGDTLALATAAAAADVPAVRRAALRILSYTGRADALPVFEAGTGDPDARVREAAIHGLSLIEGPRAVGLLLELAGDRAAATRACAIRALGGTNAEQPITEQLLRSLGDDDPWVRYYACQSLGKLGDASTVGAVVERLADVAGQVRVSAIEALSHLGGERAFEALGEAATRGDVDQRRAALVGLGLSGRPEAIPLLLPHAKADDVATRLIAISALASFQTPETLEVLGRALHDQDDNVRVAAIGLLGKRGSTEATLLLTALLKDPVNTERAHGALCQPQAERVAGLSSALRVADDDHAMQLTHILARLNQADATAALFEALTVQNPAARKAAATTLAAIGSNEARVALRRMAKEDLDAEVQRVCHLLLAQ